MRSLLRPLATLVLAVGVATCSDTPIATVKSSASPAGLGRAVVSMQPSFSKSAEFAAAHAADFGIGFDSVHIVLRGLPDTTRIVLDTTVAFRPGSPDLTLDLSVPVRSDGERFDAGLGYTLGGTIQFYGHGPVQSHAPNTPAPPQPPIVIDYHGPGARVARLSISPRTTTLSGVQSATLTVAAFDSSGASMTPPPLFWSTSNPSIVAVSAAGVVQGQNRRGSATIAVQSPTGISDNVPVSVVLPPASIVLVSGNGQTGRVGSALANPAVVQVNAADGIGVAGVNVIFSPPTGGAVSPTTATTDANGRAQTTLTLGSAAGPQSFAATASGFSVGIPETATAGAPTQIAIVAGNNQSDTARAVLAPLSVRVADQFGNPVGGATVTWRPTGGGGSFSSPTSLTNTDGIATNTYTLGSTTGTDAVTALVGETGVGFTFTVRPGGAAAIVAVSGGGQTGRVAQALDAPFVVRVNDAGGNPVSGATVTWTATNGTIAAASTTGANGQASATLTGGLSLGAAGATARIANGQNVSFAATLQAGIVSQIAFSTQPANGTPNVTLPPVRVALRDAGGNATAAINAVTIALSSNANGAVLTGTLTRNASNGVATFDDLKLDKAGAGYTLVATSGSLPSTTSAAFSTTVGGAATLTILAGDDQSSTVNSAVSAPPSVKVTDNANNPVPGIVVTFTPSSGSVAPSNGQVTTNASGVATLTSWTLGTTAGAQTLTASASGATSVTFHATAGAGAAAKLGITGIAASAVSGQALSPQPALQVRDQFGNATAAGSVTIVASSTPSSGVTIGNGSVAANPTTGVVTFTNLSVLTTAPSVTLTFAVQGVPAIQSVTSPSIAIAAATPTQLLLIPSTPTTYTKTAGSPLIPSPSVKALDANGNAVPNAGVQFVVKQGATVVATTTLTTDASGVIDGANVSTPDIAGTYTVTASLVATPAATQTVTVNVVAGGSANLSINGGNNQSATVNTAVGTAPSVKVTDASNNPVAGVVVTFTPASGSGSVSPANGQVTTNASGVATLTSWTLGTGSGARSLVASAPGASNVTFNATANADVAAKLGITGIAASAVSGQALSPQPTLQVQDQFGNATAAGTMTIVASSTPSSGVTIGNGSVAANATTGVVTFTSLSVLTTSSSVTLTFSAQGQPGITSVTSPSISITPATPTQLTLIPSTPTTYTKTAGVALSPSPTVKALDVSGNAVPGAAVQFVVKQGATVVSTTTLNADASGIVDVANLTLPDNAATYTVAASLVATPSATQTITVTVVAGNSANLAINGGNGQSATVNTAVGTAPSVKVTDASNNPVAGVVVTFTPASGSGSVSPANGQVTTNASGIATLTSWTLGTTSGAQSLVASTTGASNVTFSATANADVAAKLAITSIATSATSGQALSPQPTIQVKDQFDNATAAGAMTIVASSTPSSGVTISGGSVAANSTSGVAAFTNLYVLTTSSSVTLTFAAQGQPGITSVTSSSISISPATPAALSLVPSTATSFTKVSGAAPTSPPQVKATDSNGNAVPSANVQFTVKQGATVIGSPTTLTTDANGLVDVANVTLPDIAGSYTVIGAAVAAPTATVSISLTVTAGAADHLVTSGAAALVSDASAGVTTSPLSPTVTVVDAHGNAVTSSPTVNWSAGTCASGFILGSASASANSSGVATTSVTVPGNTAGSCEVTGTFGSSSATFYVIMKPSGSNAWTGGAGDGVYGTNGNWSAGAAPTSSSAVYIPAAVPSAPHLSANGAAGTITLETNASNNLALNTHTLTVSGNVDASGGGINNGTLTIDASAATTIRGTLPTTVIGNATSCGASSYSLNGTTTAGPVTVNCTLTIGANSLATISSGGLTVGGSAGKLVMATSGGSIDIAGLATFGGLSETGSLTNGTATFRGGLTINTGIAGVTDTYASSGSHVTQFNGTSTQHVAVCATCSAFGTIKFLTSSHVYFDNSTNFAGPFIVGTSAQVESGSSTLLTVSDTINTGAGSSLSGVSKMTLTGGARFPHIGSSGTTPANLVVQAALSLDQAAALSGNLDVQNNLTIGGNTLTVGGSFKTTGTNGLLTMTNASGLVDVSGSSTFAGASTAASLTNGTFEARGDFAQLNTVSTASYAPSGQHKTSLWGGSAQSASFADPVNSFFYNLEVQNSGITTTFTTPVLVKNDFSILRPGSTGTPQATFNDTIKVVGNLTANAGTKLVTAETYSRGRVIVGGAVTAASTSDLGGIDTLLVTGSTFPVFNNATAGKAPKLTQLTGTVALTANRTVAGGLSVGTNLELSGKTLTVLDSVNVVGNLKFLSASSGGTLIVDGNFKIAGGAVTAETGRLDVAGDFTENGSSATAFHPSSGFKTRFNGSGAQSIIFSHAGTSNSYFQDLTITNTSASGVSFATSSFVKGALLDSNNAVLKSGSGVSITAEGSVTGNNGSQMSGVTELIVKGSSFPAFNGTSTPARLTIANNVSMSADATLTGKLGVQSSLTLGGHKLSVGDSLVVEGSGYLVVQNATDSIVVHGNAEFKGGSQDNFPFSAGAFDFKGNFKASGTETFYVSTFTNNTARFTGTSPQTIDISGTSNFFANLAIGQQYSLSGYTISNSDVTFTTNTVVTGLMDLHTSAKATINANQTLTLSTSDPALNFHDGSIMVVNGTVLPVRPNCHRDDSGTHGLPQINGVGTFDGLTVSPGSASNTSITTSCVADPSPGLP